MSSKRNKLSDREVRSAAYQTLKDEGLLLPKTPEEIRALEDDFGKFPKTKLSALDALKVAKAPLPAVQQPSAGAVPLTDLIQKEFGVAARKGANIPPEVWNKMRADRKKAEEKRDRDRSK